ncbi:polyketide synthase dehydratase domain-containing protein, partial [Microbispora sp. NPDC004025]
VLPGTAYLDLALHAADHTGHTTIDELVLHAPLPLAEEGGVQIQIVVAGSDRRTVEVYSRPDGDTGDWTLHATAVLATDHAEPGFDLTAWPPPDAAQVDLGTAYDRLHEAGLGYGPAFRGLRAAWRRGDELFAEVSLPPEERGDVTGYGLHPALFDAALHVAALQWLGDTPSGHSNLPFAWSGVRLHAVGATDLRVRVTLGEAGSLSLQAADPTGAPVVSIDTLRVRPVASDQLSVKRARNDGLYRVEWTPLDVLPGEPGTWAVLGDRDLCEGLREAGVAASFHDDLAGLTAAIEDSGPLPDLVVLPVAAPGGEDPVVAAHAVTEQTLRTLQAFLADERLAGSRLLVLTRHAVAVHPDDPIDLTT